MLRFIIRIRHPQNQNHKQLLPDNQKPRRLPIRKPYKRTNPILEDRYQQDKSFQCIPIQNPRTDNHETLVEGDEEWENEWEEEESDDEEDYFFHSNIIMTRPLPINNP